MERRQHLVVHPVSAVHRGCRVRHRPGRRRAGLRLRVCHRPADPAGAVLLSPIRRVVRRRGDGSLGARALGRRRRDERAQAVAQALRAEHARAIETERAVLAERLDLARELHDAVSHILSVIAVQAGSTRYLLQRSSDDDDGRSLPALSIENASRAALDDLRRMLGLLRAGRPDDLDAADTGFLLKDTPPERLLQAVRLVAAGDALLSPPITKRLVEVFATTAPRPSTPAAVALTDRETDVLRLVAQGLSNQEIANQLTIGAATVKTYISRLLTKLNATTRVHLVIQAYESGFISR